MQVCSDAGGRFNVESGRVSESWPTRPTGSDERMTVATLALGAGDLESAARVAGRLESDGFFRPCGEMRAAIVSSVVERAQPAGLAEHISGCLPCASAVDLLRRELLRGGVDRRRVDEVGTRPRVGGIRSKLWPRPKRSRGAWTGAIRRGVRRGRDVASHCRSSGGAGSRVSTRAVVGVVLFGAVVLGTGFVLMMSSRPGSAQARVAASPRRRGQWVARRVPGLAVRRVPGAKPTIPRRHPADGRSVQRSRSHELRPRTPVVHAVAYAPPAPPAPRPPPPFSVTPSPATSAFSVTRSPPPSDPARVGSSAGSVAEAAVPLSAPAPRHARGGSRATAAATPLS
jgi:hypothetical protein